MIRNVPEGNLRDLLAYMPDACLMVAPGGRIVCINALAERLFGYRSDELEGQSLDLLIPDHLRQSHTGHVARYSERPEARGMGAGLTLSALRKDGTEIPVDVSLTPVQTDEGVRTLAAVRDISQSEERYRAVFEQVAVGVVHSGQDGRILNVNPKFCELSGYPRSEALTLDLQALIHPDDRKKSADARARLLRGEIKAFEKDIRLIRRDGASSWARLTTSVIQDAESRPLHFMSVVHDITAQVLAEQECAETELRFRQVAENINEVFWLTDPSMSEILYVSPAYESVWGRRVEDLYRSPGDWIMAIHPNDRRRVSEATQIMRVGGTYDEEYRIVRPDGAVRWIRDRGFPVRGEDGAVIRLAGISDDVTEQRLAEAGIHRLNRVYAVLSGINALIVRASDRHLLLRDACRIAVNAGGFSVAWSGLLDPVSNEFLPVAWEGVDEQYMVSVAETLREATRSAFIGRALREKRPAISTDLEHDPDVRMKAEILAQGTRAIVALPLVVGDRAVGVLALHARDPGFFDEEEMKLLLELAADISFALDHIEKADRVHYLALHDSLTDLPNRNLFCERLEQAIGGAARDERRLAVLAFDIERFRTINETLGRQAGDELLSQISERARRHLGDENSIARIGPDQFAWVLPSVTTSGAVMRRIEERMQQILGEAFDLSGTEIRVTAKIGVTVYPDDGPDAEGLLRNAEAALRKAKSSGERYLFFAPEMTARAAERLALDTQLRSALEREEFFLHYQPKFDLQSRRIAGVEALLRWQSPERGLVTAGEIIPLMEETGLILQVGTWAMAQAVEDHRRWLELGLAAPRVAMNVSALHLRQRGFVAFLRQTLARGSDPPGLDLEITESLVMENIEENIETLRSIRELGVDIAIDDFGTGYSSLAYLARLPANFLKIDRAFIATMLDDPNALTLVQTVISLAHSLRLKVIAEGVETEEQAKVLRLLRCDEIQGYLVGRPMPFDEITRLLEGNPLVLPLAVRSIR
jgi:diguanylate cyclase (GGDEF)-like protein/PAS domain S-box-containing protein